MYTLGWPLVLTPFPSPISHSVKAFCAISPLPIFMSLFVCDPWHSTRIACMHIHGKLFTGALTSGYNTEGNDASTFSKLLMLIESLGGDGCHATLRLPSQLNVAGPSLVQLTTATVGELDTAVGMPCPEDAGLCLPVLWPLHSFCFLF